MATPAQDTVELARRIRAHCVRMTHHAQASHIGTCLSRADLLAVLYSEVLRVDPARPEWADRDRFILSKGHGAAGLYAVLAERGFFPREWLATYGDDGGRLATHVVRYGVPEHLRRAVRVGSRVTVPLGRGNRLEQATVLELSGTPPAAQMPCSTYRSSVRRSR